MERLPVKYKPNAIESIGNIAIYIEEKGFPQTAERFADALYDFGDSLGHLPLKYAVCSHGKFKKYGFRCAVFKKNYIFVYGIENNTVVIYFVIDASRLK